MQEVISPKPTPSVYKIHLGLTGVDGGFNNNGRSRTEGLVGGEEAYYDSDDHGCDNLVSDDDEIELLRRNTS